MEVHAILTDKARRVFMIASSKTVEDAISLMASVKVSALVVTENDEPAGIFSKEDFFNSLLKHQPATFSEIKLENAMNRNILQAEPKDPIVTVLDKMVETDISHVPVIDEMKIIGMLTITDLMQHRIESLTDEIHQLKDYIVDLHEAKLD